MKTHKLIGLILIVLTSGCATPPEVKQLSVKQMDYFDSAIQAVSLQSDALILATEKLVSEAKQRIDTEEASNRARFDTLIQHGIATQADAAKITTRVAERHNQAMKAKEKLDSDLLQIKHKAAELKSYLVKMKEVHIAIDAYIQSEKAGELVVKDVFNQPSVTSLLDKVNTLTPKVQSSIADMQTLLNGL